MANIARVVNNKTNKSSNVPIAEPGRIAATQQAAMPAQTIQHLITRPSIARPANILQLQRTLGNRAVGAILSQSVPKRPLIQAKLTVNAPGDKYEQEADRVAEEVMRMPAVQWVELDGKDKELEIMTKREPMHNIGDVFEAGETFEQQLHETRGQGQSLPTGLREEFEGKFGVDFSGVRIHADTQSDALNRSIQAKAFTTGQDVFFRQGAYEPRTRDGQGLIAHELTHVVQQKHGERSPEKQKGSAPRNNRPDIVYNMEQNYVQRKFGFELEMKIPYGKQSSSGTSIDPVMNGKAEEEQVKHESGKFKIVGDKTQVKSGTREKNINSIVELVTTPIDESQLKTADEVSTYFEPLVETGRELAAMIKAKDKKLSEFKGFKDDKNHWICPTKASFDMRDDAYVQGTYGLSMLGLGDFIEKITNRIASNSMAKVVHTYLKESLITKEEVTSAIGAETIAGAKSTADIEAGSMAGYLTYIATMINSGKQGAVSSLDIAKNIVPLLNKAQVTTPALGSLEVREALRKLLISKCKVNDSTILFQAGGENFKKPVKALLDSVLPLNGPAQWKENMLGEDWVTNKGEQGSPKRDVIFEERRVFPTSALGNRLKIDQWIPVITAYWEMLKIANSKTV